MSHKVKFIRSAWPLWDWSPFRNDKARHTSEISSGDMTAQWAAEGPSIHRDRKMSLLRKTFASPAPCVPAALASPKWHRKKEQTRRLCRLYPGDLCWCFGRCICSNNEAWWKFNKDERKDEKSAVESPQLEVTDGVSGLTGRLEACLIFHISNLIHRPTWAFQSYFISVNYTGGRLYLQSSCDFINQIS